MKQYAYNEPNTAIDSEGNLHTVNATVIMTEQDAIDLQRYLMQHRIANRHSGFKPFDPSLLLKEFKTVMFAYEIEPVEIVAKVERTDTHEV